MDDVQAPMNITFLNTIFWDTLFLKLRQQIVKTTTDSLTACLSVVLPAVLLVLFTTAWALPISAASAAPELSHADESAKAYIIEPQDNQHVPSEFAVKFGLSGMGVAPAGVNKEGTGHHHLLIDVDELPPLTEPLAATSQIRHFGGGQTEAVLTLPPGEHTLQLILGNYTHVPHDNPVLSEKIEIIVE